MQKVLIIFITLIAFLFMTGQVLTYEQVEEAVQTKSQFSNDKALPGVFMLLLGETERFTLTINTAGEGQGQVHISPSGDDFESGTLVSLTAEADLGYVFTGWGGACSGTQLTCQGSMSQALTVTANFSIASTEPLSNQAVLGPLAGSTIRAYRLNNLSRPIEGPFLANNSVNLQAAGSFDLSLSGIPNNEWILVTATGGWDIDANDDGIIDQNPVRNKGTAHALARASQWRQGGLKINSLTDIAWRYSHAWLGEASLAELEKRLDQIAGTLLVEKVQDEGEVDYNDLLKFIPGNEEQRAKLSFDYHQLLDSEGFIPLIHANAASQDLDEALTKVFGAHLSFAFPDNLENEVQVRLAAFGRGQVISSDENLFIDSEADASVQKTLAFYPRDREDPVELTATPIDATEILGWTGCDWISSDQTRCRVGLESSRQVHVNFGYKEAVINPNFVDLSPASVIWSGDIISVTVDEHDEELLAIMADIAKEWFVAGMSDKGPFLLQVIAVLSQQKNTWELRTIQASLEEVILQGSGTILRSLTHGDLEPDVYTTRVRSETGEILPIRLVPSKDTNDTVFRLQIGDVPDPEGILKAITGDLVIRSGSSEIRLNGVVEVDIIIDAGISYGPILGLEYFKFVPETGVRTGLSMTCSGKITGTRKKKIHTLAFKPIKFMAGPVPIWVSPRVDIYLGVQGSVEAALSMGVSYTMISKGGVQYTQERQWEAIRGFSRQWNFQEPEFNAEGSIKGYVLVQPDLMIYNLTGPGLAIVPNLMGNVTKSFDPDCPDALDWGLWCGINANLQWSGNENVPILGNALAELSLSFQFYHWNRKVTGGVLNPCDEPPRLDVQGSDINQTILHGTSENLQTTYTLSNFGEQDMPWRVTPSSTRIHVHPGSGNLEPGESVEVNVSVLDTHTLGLGTHNYRLDFINDFQGPIGQSGLGSTDRTIIVSVIPNMFLSGWHKSPVNGHYYRVTFAMNFHEAEALARKHNGHLVTIRNQQEEQWIFDEFGPGPFLIGLNIIGRTYPNYAWSSGEQVTYTRWTSDDPKEYTCTYDPEYCPNPERQEIVVIRPDRWQPLPHIPHNAVIEAHPE